MQQEATHISRPVDDKIMEFVVFAIESAAQKTGIPAPVLYNRLEKVDLISRYLIEGYDMLHTQSREYIKHQNNKLETNPCEYTLEDVRQRLSTTGKDAIAGIGISGKEMERRMKSII